MRPALVISATTFNQGPAGLAVIIPLTTRSRRIASWIEILPPEGGIRQPSYVMCEQVRSASRERLVEQWGTVSARTVVLVEDLLRILLQL